jgi:hypothetical protein
MQRHFYRCRIDIIRALAHVDVLKRVQVAVFALLVPHQFQRPVRDHLVGVHIGGRTGAALDHIDYELIEQRAIADFLARPDDRVGFVVVEKPELAVGKRRAGDREIFQRPQRMYAVIDCGGHIAVAQQIMFESGGAA